MRKDRTMPATHIHERAWKAERKREIRDEERARKAAGVVVTPALAPTPNYWSAAKQEQARLAADPMRYFRRMPNPEQERDR